MDLTMGGSVIPIVAVDSRVVTTLVVAGGIGVFGLLLILTAAGELRGRRKAKVPVGFRPGPSDEQLERSVLERTMLWGAVSTLVIALWLPAYWLREPKRLAEAHDKFQTREVASGRALYEDFQCTLCHGENAEGGTRSFSIDGVEHRYAEPPLKYIYSRYAATGMNEDQITQLILDAINRGREGTPMPTWGIAFGGPLNSAQVDDLVLYLQSIQEEFPDTRIRGGRALFEANCGICHNAPGADDDPSKIGAGGVGPNLRVAFERLTREQIFNTIKNGRLNVNRPSMPAWAALGDQAIEALVRFIQSIQRSR